MRTGLANGERWTATRNTLPDDEITVLIAFDNGDVATGYLEGDLWFDLCGIQFEDAKATHWMHIPEHPNA